MSGKPENVSPVSLTKARIMPRRLEDLAVFAAPGVFVVLWASGFVGAKNR
jgi:hypothetical protein